ncbi:hypothetical protein HJG60_007726 [Phyllostomus discolor]|uniref:Uncharacterized protein n=1 Tax=Phyllostomus discolor TaxID=89673 RepID=A0A834BJB0_9CHIR|nr:hypothetical protein HJG60_007726 [Phyllostomus discolor]
MGTCASAHPGPRSTPAPLHCFVPQMGCAHGRGALDPSSGGAAVPRFCPRPSAAPRGPRDLATAPGPCQPREPPCLPCPSPCRPPQTDHTDAVPAALRPCGPAGALTHMLPWAVSSSRGYV